ncbi:MAG: hypothetical protein ABL902_08070 [Gallionella sp.]|nr:hypothetical protein [Gallionella sp.]
MEAVEDFMWKYFAMRSELMRAAKERSISFRERCFTDEYLAASKKVSEKSNVYEKIIPPVVLQVEMKGISATVITSEPACRKSERRIYKLRSTDIGWQIERKGTECFLCEGLGVYNGETCSNCGGNKWEYHGASKR